MMKYVVFVFLILGLSGCTLGPGSSPLSIGPAKPSASDKPMGGGDVKTDPVNWTAVSTSFFETKCNSCHFAGNRDGLSNYQDIETVKATIGTIFYTTVISPMMPPPPNDWDEKTSNPNQLSRAEKNILSQWIIDGMR